MIFRAILGVQAKTHMSYSRWADDVDSAPCLNRGVTDALLRDSK